MKSFSGFTLNELIISLAIFAILTSTGISGLFGFIANHQADSGYRQLFTLLQFARSQSVFYRQQVIVCPSLDGENCLNDWTNSLIVFVDENKNIIHDENDILLQTFVSAEENNKRIVTAFGSTKHISFNFDGTSGSNNGRLSYCILKGDKTYARQIIIAKTGRVRKGDEADAKTKCAA